MTPQQGVLHLVRDSDPRSSHEAAARCRPNFRRQMILAALAEYPEGWEPHAWLTADSCVDRWDGQRSVWSKRLSEAAQLGLLECDRSTSPIRFRLTAEGRRAVS